MVNCQSPEARRRIGLRDASGCPWNRRHAVIEQVIAELKSAGLAGLPSGRFTANAAWLALAVMAHNLGGAVGPLECGEHLPGDASTCHPRSSRRGSCRFVPMCVWSIRGQDRPRDSSLRQLWPA